MLRQSSVIETERILSGEMPSRFVYSPNYWQWFKHHQDHDKLPAEISHCNTLTELYEYLGVDIFSRNIYSDPEKYWFGGLCTEINEGFSVEERFMLSGRDKATSKIYRSKSSCLDERLVYKFEESTLVQDKFLVTDYVKEYSQLLEFVKNRRWIFKRQKYNEIFAETEGRAIVVAGEFFSPLKMLHLVMGPVNSVYFLMERPEEAQVLMKLHEDAQLECLKEAVSSGVKVVMAMDNLDTMFHPPDYVEKYSASFYTRASEICHSAGARFFIHACGQQKDNLKLISSYGVDGLEGVAAPPLGDVLPEEVMECTHDHFIMTGGISAFETRDLKTKKAVFEYVEKLFRSMLRYRNRFIFSSSCNTAINTSWETIINFRDAWLNYRYMQ